MNNSLHQSLKDRLKQISKIKNQTPAELWQILVLERILVRIIKSKYRDNFIFKGGLLLSKYIEIGRETKDLDFVVKKIKKETNNLEKIFKEIAEINIQDGFIFKNIKIHTLSHLHMEYLGSRVFMDGFFEKTRFKVQIDLGFGDIIEPILKNIELMKDRKGPLFESHIEIVSYPQEFIFAEKLHSIVARGQANSRMKDFHDLYLLINQKENTFQKQFMLIIKKVFDHRNSKFLLPLKFNDKDFYELQNFWKRHLSKLNKNHIFPSEIKDVILAINKWLEKKIISEK